ncbi:diphosphate--fructose-6-phosphate 1-phosphotransferase [Metabacillus rhizolycopersici]|uniref:Diphosphate--fructose-6-phosphate 1-phosphotransferase n=1 Tax=Metabacillus rhizolycopersici TaxID=2875709 RepID=A0ABS7UW35_9BACI|nr:diphosphate--fructose-6-phosphate 1-phosphotransferase [Metabacillus rhizolycopersici]MBZ5752503.1 diphosphate--fructose-6-phosphate 1-phosphotransferase [Metabacillus rhizolycopersici]
MNIFVAQSGGPTPVINSTLYGVLAQSLELDEIKNVIASVDGLEGILRNNIIHLTNKIDLIKNAKEQPGAILGGSRYELTNADLEKIVDKLLELSINVFCYIGGNGSSRTINKVHEICKSRNLDIRCIFIPKTVDNDIFGTDHTPGYISAAKFLLHSLKQLEADIRSNSFPPQIEIMEVMGGNAGWLIGASAIRKKHKNDFPQLVYLPERETTIEEILSDIQSAMKENTNILIMVSDHMKLTSFTSEINHHNPRQKYNGGISYRLAQEIQKHLEIKTSITIPNKLYRSSMNLVSHQDLQEAEIIGKEAIRTALKGETGKMIGIERTSSNPYEYKLIRVDLSEISGKERVMPSDFWDSRNFMPTDKFKNYLLPLLEKEINMDSNYLTTESLY